MNATIRIDNQAEKIVLHTYLANRGNMRCPWKSGATRNTNIVRINHR